MKLKRTIIQFFTWFSNFVEKKWYLPLIHFIAILALFVAVIPMDLILVLSVLVKPSYWMKIPLAIGAGSAIGGFILSEILKNEHYFKYFWKYFDLHLGLSWGNEILLNHGILGLTALILMPIPLTPLVIYCAHLRIPSSDIFMGVWFGRTLKYSLIGKIVRLLPNFFRKKLNIRPEINR